MNSDNKNMIYTARDIEEYLSGKLSASQMHAIEKAALDDPFLAEAIEGYEGMKDHNWKDQLAAARQQVTETGFEAKVIPMHRSTGRWWKIAAAVFVIGCGTVLTFILTKNKTEEKSIPQIAQTIPVSPDSGIVNHTPDLPPVAEPVPPAHHTVKAKEGITASTNGNVSQPPPPPVMMNDRYTYKSGNAQASDSVNFSKQSQHYATINQTPNAGLISPSTANNNAFSSGENSNAKNAEMFKQKNDNSNSFNRQQGYVANANSKKELNNYFTAQIVGADNSPLPFTNVSITKENFGTYADAKGVVRLVSTDSVLNIELRSVGYLPRTFTLRSNQPQNKIVLEEEAVVFADKMVSADKDLNANKRSRRATLLTDSAVNVEPVDGWENYNTYMANNIDIPDEMLKKDFHGEVELSFDLKANGSISNIRVNKSLGTVYDEEAKRLIQQGPKWKVKKGKKTSASVKVKF